MSSQYTLSAPDFIARAFYKVYVHGATDDAYEAFASRWGGINFAIFQQVCEVGEGDDKLVAMFALGFSGLKEAADILAPLLQSARRKERWVSALCLGSLRDERALQALQNLVVDGLSPKERIWTEMHPEEIHSQEIFWVRNYRFEAIELLEYWNDQSLVPLLRRAFLSIWEIQQTLQRSILEEGSFDALAYVLGAYNDLTVLDGLDLPAAHKKVALVYLSLGLLHAKTFVGSHLMSAMIENKELQEQVAQVLEQHFGLSAGEQKDCVKHFYKNMQIRNEYGMEGSSHEGDASSLQIDEEEDGDEEEEEDAAPFSIASPPLSMYKGHTKTVHSLSWSPDGAYLVSGSGDLTAQVWEATTGKRLVTFAKHFASVNVVSWSPKGDLIASGGNDNCVYVWDAFTGKQVTAYERHHSWICRGLGWSPDGTLIASASWDHTVQVWEALTGKTILIYRGHTAAVVSLAWSLDGTRIATGSGYPDATVHVWDAQTGSLICSYRGHCQVGDTTQGKYSEEVHDAGSARSLAWSSDGMRIASASTGSYWICRVWDATNGKVLLVRDQKTWGPVVWALDGTTLISPGLYTSTVDQWDATTGQIKINYAPETLHSIEALAWSADGKRIAAADAMNTIQVWETYQTS